MSAPDDSSVASSGQQKSPKKKRTPQPRDVRPPVIEPGGIYSLQDLVVNCKADPAKFREWGTRDKDGLYPLDTETAAYFYSADEVIEFWLNRPRRKLEKKATTTPKQPKK